MKLTVLGLKFSFDTINNYCSSKIVFTVNFFLYKGKDPPKTTLLMIERK